MTVKSFHNTATLRKLAAATTVATALITALAGSPASAGIPDDLWNLLNNAHIAAGCPGYGGADALSTIAVSYAKTMAFNNGHNKTSGGFNVSTGELLENQGYYPAALGEIYYFNPGGADANAAADWLKNNPDTSAVLRRCDLTQMALGVWINGSNWAAAALIGTPGTPPDPGPAPVVK